MIRIIKKNSNYKLDPGPMISPRDIVDLIANGHNIEIVDHVGADITEPVLKKLAFRVFLESLISSGAFAEATGGDHLRYIKHNSEPRDTHITRRFRGGSQD